MMPMTTGGELERDELRRFRILRPGLSLHFGNEVQCEEAIGQAVVHDNIRIVLLLEGVIDISYGRSHIQLVAPHQPSQHRSGQKQDAAIVTILEPEECRRIVRQGDCSRRISIGLSKQWLQESLCEDMGSEVAGSFGAHLETRTWNVSPRARMLAEQMLHPPAMPRHIIGMYQESRAIELVIEGLSQAAPAVRRSAPLPTLRPAAYQRMQDLKVWLREHASAPLCIEQIARHLNTTSTTLQRHFRLAHGITVFEYLQQERLRQARCALEREGVSVGDAAALAGYANQNSFATAFKRRFGLSPKQVRPQR